MRCAFGLLLRFGSQRSAVLPDLIPFHSYLELFETGNDEILRTNFMNIALFYPAGLLLAPQFPENWPRNRKMLFVGIAFALLSVVIEYAQFRYSLGEPEIDDVIHNTFGAITGALPIVFQDIQ